MCTTEPPAKSSTPIWASQPPGSQTQWAMGAYTSSSHRLANTSSAPNRMRSTSAPTTSAQVMMAKVSWNMANTDSGTSGAMWLTATWPLLPRNSRPAKPMRSTPPIQAPSAWVPGVKASEYATPNHSTLTTAAMPTTLAMVLITLKRRTMPP